MRRFLRDNGLSVALFALFLVSLIGQALTGWRAHAEELRLHAQPEIGLAEYLASGHFISAVFENWESEFLQTVSKLRQVDVMVAQGQPTAAAVKKIGVTEQSYCHSGRLSRCKQDWL